MAGGEGTRLRPLTSNTPKPMMPLVNEPMMEHIVRLLKQHGFDEIVVTLAFLPNAIRNYFGDGSEFGVRMVYATEDSPLGTAGSVANARAELTERFLVISGDVLTDIDLTAIVKYHEEKAAMATIGLKAMENPLEFGIVITNEDGSIQRFLEKPTWGQVFSDTINTGIYVLEPEIFDYIPDGAVVDFSSDVFPRLLDDAKPLFGFVAERFWEDVGTLDAYRTSHQDVLDGKVELELPGFGVGGGIYLGEGSEVSPDARIDGPVVIGDYCKIEAGAEVRPYTVLGSNVFVGTDAFVERAVVHDNAYIGHGARIRGCVLGRNTDVRSGARIEEGVVIGDECLVGEHAVINPDVKVYPFKTIEPGAVINSSIVWESRGSRTLFGRHGVSGLANVDISPELAVKVAMAYATTLKKGARVTVSRDSSRAARTLKRAVMVGLNAAGVDVDDLEVAAVPLTRFQVRSERTRGGVTVRLAPGDGQTVRIRFFDDEGLDIDEVTQRKIERLYYREDFRRAFAADMGEIGFPPRAVEYYTAALMQSVDVRAIRQSSFKIVLDYAYGATSFVMPNVLAKLGAEVLAVNPYASTVGIVEFDAEKHAKDVADLVRASHAHLGAVIHPDGEHITLIDDSGHALNNDEALFALLMLVGQVHPNARVALPVAVSRAAETVCESAGMEICWTKLSTPHLMEVASSGDVAFAASQSGGFIFPAFLPAYDAAATLVHLLAMLASAGGTLSKVVAKIPRLHICHEVVPTPWEQKGTVMRSLVESLPDDDLVLVDGVKVLLSDGWVLVLPDPDDAVTHVWAEGPSDSDARTRSAEYTKRIRSILR